MYSRWAVLRLTIMQVLLVLLLVRSKALFHAGIAIDYVFNPLSFFFSNL